MKIRYTDGPAQLELPNGLGIIERDVPKDVPDDIGKAMVEQGGFEAVTESKRIRKSEV